ncbi:glutathione S-transferase [Polyporus arcularius HHB13444]|uniref:glutathione transferase n=1 Tax=Polyporus arcularius HHB13444 TaxID=1314778 RepID=A0A5C3PJ01_9APHY|nr:glutathione S-transferase [Polyporus arcularius HHB13444]
MVLKLHGAQEATCTKRVLTVLEELNVPYELVVVDYATDAHKSPAFRAVQPFGQFPYLDDDGFTLYESRAIARYLALKYGGIGTLIPDPADLAKTALFEQAASVEQSNFDAFAVPLAYENIRKPRIGQQTDKAAVERLTAALEAKLAVYDTILGRSKYLAGDELTLADLFHLPYGSNLAKQNIDFLESPKYPNVARWWKDISGRASWKKVNGA